MYQVLLFKFRRHLCKGSIDSTDFAPRSGREEIGKLEFTFIEPLENSGN